MGSLNKVPPITETHHDMIPAQPGWFNIEWQGDVPNSKYEISKTPIVAWMVETQFWRRTKMKAIEAENRSVKVETNDQDCFALAYPVTPLGVDYNNNNELVALGPDGCVYQLCGAGLHWPDIPSYVKWSYDQVVAREKADERRAAAKQKATTL
jgi:hypothetical protein